MSASSCPPELSLTLGPISTTCSQDTRQSLPLLHTHKFHSRNFSPSQAPAPGFGPQTPVAHQPCAQHTILPTFCVPRPALPYKHHISSPATLLPLPLPFRISPQLIFAQEGPEFDRFVPCLTLTPQYIILVITPSRYTRASAKHLILILISKAFSPHQRDLFGQITSWMHACMPVLCNISHPDPVVL